MFTKVKQEQARKMGQNILEQIDQNLVIINSNIKELDGKLVEQRKLLAEIAKKVGVEVPDVQLQETDRPAN